MACYLLCLKCECKNVVCCQVKCICCNVWPTKKEGQIQKAWLKITCVCSMSALFIIKKHAQMECWSQIKKTYCILFFIGLIFLSKMHNIITKPMYFLKTHEHCTLFVCVGSSDHVDLILTLMSTWTWNNLYFSKVCYLRCIWIQVQSMFPFHSSS